MYKFALKEVAAELKNLLVLTYFHFLQCNAFDIFTNFFSDQCFALSFN